MRVFNKILKCRKIAPLKIYCIKLREDFPKLKLFLIPLTHVVSEKKTETGKIPTFRKSLSFNIGKIDF